MKLNKMRGILKLFKKGLKAKNQYNFAELCVKLSYQFRDHDVLLQALKHRSFLTDTGEPRIESNERLELLGDAVLGLLVTEFLYKTFPNEEEGTLTNFRSLLVNRRYLAKVANSFDLGKYLFMNDAEDRSGGRKRPSILSDGMEAIVGAVYVDGGIEAARNFVKKNMTSNLDELLSQGQILNYKSMLLEYCQSLNQIGPKYYVEKEDGPDHEKMFTVSVNVEGKKIGLGKGPSKKMAEQKAAKEALTRLKLI